MLGRQPHYNDGSGTSRGGANMQPTFKLKRLVAYTDDAIIREMRRVADLLQNPALTVSLFEKHSRVSRTTITRRFGSWGRALDAAGLGNRFSEVVGVAGANVAHRLSKDQILKLLQYLAAKLGKKQLTVADVEEHLPFTRSTLIRRWGTSRSAFEAAGLSSTNLGRRYTDEECFNNLLAVWTHFGRPPTYLEMSAPPSQVGGKAYSRRFGTWQRALHAFVDQANSSAEEETITSSTHIQADVPLEAMHHRSSPEIIRDIPLGLRFRVLRRDRFRCVLCGDSPPMNPECILHVDHIVPWSKGGKTISDNLRTLCATCNVGRGNRFED